MNNEQSSPKLNRGTIDITEYTVQIPFQIAIL